MSPVCGQRVWVSQRTCVIVTKSGIKSVKFEPAIPTEYMTMAGPVHVRTGPATPFKTTRRTSTRQRKRPRGSLRLGSGKIGPVRGHRRMGHRQGGKVCGEKGVWGTRASYPGTGALWRTFRKPCSPGLTGHIRSYATHTSVAANPPDAKCWKKRYFLSMRQGWDEAVACSLARYPSIGFVRVAVRSG